MYRETYIGNRKYYLYDTYRTREEAYKVGKYKKRKNKANYFIIKKESGHPIPTTRYLLYLKKRIMKLW